MRQILTGTQYGIVERAAEVPKGYSWKGYLLDGEPVRTSQDEGIQGVMPEGSNPDPVAVVQNYKGYDDGTVISRSGSGRTYDFDTGTYTLKVTNTAGTELPASGGPGTALFYILGLILLAVSGSALVIRRRMQHR